ncbi:hypothetical protein H5410_049137 [Solanum commersonii]|uniref:NB-ARC domain-containing protein n=1 Tax=Solanum commersonii TaxID=4109 RepID=A0A9J5XML2_SOLCO|nr:hypothetical protein H5410_049137 [Solanum commersonii]
MGFLRYIYVSEIIGYIDHEKLEGLQARIQFMADNVGQFCLALWVAVGTDDILSKPDYLLCLIVLVELEMKNIFLGELKASKYAKSRTFKDKKLPKGFSHHLHSLLVYLRNKKIENFPNNVSSRNIDVTIEFLLVFLNDDGSNHVISGNWLNEVMEKVGAIAGDVLYVIQKLLPRSKNKNDTSNINVCSIQILEKVEDLKAQVEKYYKSLKFTPSQFPTVGGLSFLDSLLRKLHDMLKFESGLVFMMKPGIGNLEQELSSLTSILEKELSSLSSIFRDVAKVHNEHKILKDLQRRTVNLAYEAEVSIDSILAQYNAFWHIFCSLPAILKEINHINVEVTEIWLANVALKPCYVVAPSKYLSTQHSNPATNEVMVGFGNDIEIMIQYLIRGTNELDVVPIVGMGGQGKTTIARKVYDNESIVSRFDVRAWCIISQTYSRKELLQEIFSQVTGYKDKVDEVGELADRLRKSLMGKRYLIVLDDMWDGMAWDDLILCFPDVGNRSRIVVTTRLERVGEYVKRYTDLYFLPFLTPDESCELLQKKVFQKEGFPPELQDACLAVAEKCKGLPLVIILVAGIIKGKKMDASWWYEVKDALFDYLDRESGEYSLSTMQLSYDNLPDYLKPCLLYMGMFPEDARIPVSKLINLWIAEGFVQNIRSRRLMEEAAEDYLKDLISSNVVMVSWRRYNGEVKYCQVHDVVLHFCLARSREEQFMMVMKGHYRQFQPSHWKESRVSFSFSNELSTFVSLGSKTQKPFHQRLRSLIMTNRGEYYDLNQCGKLRLLKVLDLSCCSVRALSSATLKPLIHLKYLEISTDEFNIHPEPHLPHLETLIVVSSYYSTVVLPIFFWKMDFLRHVKITRAEFDLEEDKQMIFKESFKLENLRILRGVDFQIHQADSVDVLLRRCPNLQQLDIRFKDNEVSAEICPNLESLTQLQILRLSFQWPQIVSGLHLPANLKKLELSRTRIRSTISFIAGLPSLEYLKLSELYFIQSEEWCLGDITFPNLKFLKLAWFFVSRWDASEESFPLLETLVIRECDKLEEIPLSFADIPTLKQIKLINCKNKSLEASALKIKEEVTDIEGCDRIDITIGNIESGRLEESAEEYLMDLIRSNVVMVSRTRYNGNLEKELSSLTSILEKEQSSIFRDVVRHEHKIPKDLQRRTINLAYEAEVAIDSILAQYNAFLHIFCSLPTILKEIKQSNAEVTEMWSADIPLNPHYVAAPFKHLPARHSNLVTDEEVVGPIVGMGGQGKTTIARKLYNNNIIVSRFDVRAWWDDLRLSFPDVGIRSRIVVTTRLEEVGKQVKYHTDPYSLPFLTTEESCQLLQKKVFQKEDCPPELQYVSQAVAEKCKGLPLVVVLVSGIIKKRKMEESWWNEVKDALFDYLDSEFEEYSLATMQLSFDNLPHCSKPCLLYMGMFSEDASISASKLISLWIAEGFVENTESGRLMEEEAEGYLMDLISSNMVIVSKKGYNGKVKCCQVHDVVHHFCLEKCREEKFMLAVKGQYIQFQPLDWKGSRVIFSFSEKHSKLGSLVSITRKHFRQHLRNVRFSIDEADRLDVLLQRCPNLQQLHIDFEDSYSADLFGDDYAESFCLTLENLTQLQILRLSIESPIVLSSWLQLPSNLKKLVVFETIKLIRCRNESPEASAERIKEEAETIEGCDRIDLIIKVSRNKLLCAVFEYICASNLIYNTESVVKSKADVNQACAFNHWQLLRQPQTDEWMEFIF